MAQEKNALIQIKGIKDGLMVTLGEGEWPDLEAALLKYIVEQGNFFQGARLALDIGNQILHAAEMGALRDRLSDRHVSLWAIISNSPTTEQTAQMLGLATRISQPRPERVIRPLDTNMEGENAMLIQRTLRSGFRTEFDGHVIVIGDVNPGAEIVAGGNVVVWGKLRGNVHAGRTENKEAVICALDMNPMQMRIADVAGAIPAHKGKSQPQMAVLVNDQLVFKPWESK